MEHAVTVDIIEGETEGKRREGEVEPRQHTAVSILHRGLRSALVSIANKQPPLGITCKDLDQKNQSGSVPGSVRSMIGVRSDQHVLEPKPNEIRLKWVMERFSKIAFVNP